MSNGCGARSRAQRFAKVVAKRGQGPIRRRLLFWVPFLFVFGSLVVGFVMGAYYS